MSVYIVKNIDGVFIMLGTVENTPLTEQEILAKDIAKTSTYKLVNSEVTDSTDLNVLWNSL